MGWSGACCNTATDCLWSEIQNCATAPSEARRNCFGATGRLAHASEGTHARYGSMSVKSHVYAARITQTLYRASRIGVRIHLTIKFKIMHIVTNKLPRPFAAAPTPSARRCECVCEAYCFKVLLIHTRTCTRNGVHPWEGKSGNRTQQQTQWAQASSMLDQKWEVTQKSNEHFVAPSVFIQH